MTWQKRLIYAPMVTVTFVTVLLGFVLALRGAILPAAQLNYSSVDWGDTIGYGLGWAILAMIAVGGNLVGWLVTFRVATPKSERMLKSALAFLEHEGIEGTTSLYECNQMLQSGFGVDYGKAEVVVYSAVQELTIRRPAKDTPRSRPTAVA